MQIGEELTESKINRPNLFQSCYQIKREIGANRCRSRSGESDGSCLICVLAMSNLQLPFYKFCSASIWVLTPEMHVLCEFENLRSLNVWSSNLRSTSFDNDRQDLLEVFSKNNHKSFKWLAFTLSNSYLLSRAIWGDRNLIIFCTYVFPYILSVLIDWDHKRNW